MSETKIRVDHDDLKPAEKHKVIYEGLSEKKRARKIMDLADDQEQVKVFTGFTALELKERKDEHMVKSIELQKEDDELTAIKETFKETMNPLKSRLKSLVKEIGDEGIYETQTLYAIPNRDEGMMEYYNVEGVYICGREIGGFDNQTTLHEQIRGTEE